MSERTDAVAVAPEVTVQLLDAAHEWSLKTWKFRAKAAITIGRSEDRDVEIIDSYVSRSHAVLEYRDGGWVLISQGRNGVFVNNKPVQEILVDGDVVCRLGATGPKLMFKTRPSVEDCRATLSLESMPMSQFAIDQTRLDEEVRAIANRDDFQRLRQQAHSLRQRRSAT